MQPDFSKLKPVGTPTDSQPNFASLKSVSSTPDLSQSQTPNPFADIASNPLKADPNITSGYQIPAELAKTGVNLATAPIRTVKTIGDAASSAGALFGENFSSLKDPSSPTNPFALLTKGFLDTGGKLLDQASKPGKFLLGAISDGIKKVTGYSLNPDDESTFKGAIDVLKDPEKRAAVVADLHTQLVEHPENTLLALDGLNESLGKDVVSSVAKPVVDEAKNLASDTMGAVKNAVSSPASDVKVLDQYNRSIKPTIAGKSTPAAVSAYNDKVVNGVNSIVENKNNLSFEDADGNVLKGDTPKTVEQFSQAIDQTKKSIYKQYDALAQSSEGKGTTIDLAGGKTKPPTGGPATSITDELDTIIKDKSLPISNPEVIQKAIALKDRILHEVETGTEGNTIKTIRQPINAEFAQNLLQQLNDKLKSFYRNPTPAMASEASLDAMVANKVRGLLDTAIENTEGPGYQALKNKYGALKAMEADVTKRAQVYGRQNIKGLIDYSDIFTAGQVVKGVLTMNPAEIATGVFGKAVKEFIKWKNSPDRGIEQMFNEAQKPSAASAEAFTPKSNIGKYIKKPQAGLSIGDISKNISPAEKGTIRDFTDWKNGAYKPDAKTLESLKRDAQEIATKYKFSAAMKGDQALSNQFGEYLDSVGFDKKLTSKSTFRQNEKTGKLEGSTKKK